MKRTIGLISVVAIAMALIIAFSGVASASFLAEPMPEIKTFNTLIGYDRPITGDQGFDFWKSSSGNLLDNPPSADFNKNFYVYTGNATNPDVTKRYSIGYTSRLGSLPIIPASWKEMNDKIDAGGSKDGSMAKGRISAGVSVYVVDGSDGGLGSRLSYQERSSASGSFQFHKVMSYTSKITMP